MNNKLYLTILLLITTSSFLFAQKEINDIEFKEKVMNNKESKLIFVDFYATWCGPCKLMNPYIELLELKYGESVIFYKMDIDKCSIDDGVINSVPTYFLIKEGKMLEIIEGIFEYDKMESLIKKYK